MIVTVAAEGEARLCDISEPNEDVSMLGRVAYPTRDQRNNATTQFDHRRPFRVDTPKSITLSSLGVGWLRDWLRSSPATAESPHASTMAP
jgi:hypothetical protein